MSPQPIVYRVPRNACVQLALMLNSLGKTVERNSMIKRCLACVILVTMIE